MESIRIVLADDHRLLREGLLSLLGKASDCEVVADVGDGVAALDAIREQRPDIAVLDHSMPGLTGLEVARTVNAGHLPTRCVMLSSFSDPMLVAEMIRAGARGYLVKEDAFDEVLAAIRAVAAGEIYFSVGIDVPKLKEALQVLSITVREAEVLAGLIKGRSAREIADALGIGTRTVETYRNQLVAKFGARNATDLVAKAIRS
ncbi:MAG: response regulator transcription factor, partial [Verrucomicrobiae bacterium]|nr:response regulator transcription factor [Verrucomicrobiae bacterium]